MAFKGTKFKTFKRFRQKPCHCTGFFNDNLINSNNTLKTKEIYSNIIIYIRDVDNEKDRKKRRTIRRGNLKK